VDSILFSALPLRGDTARRTVKIRGVSSANDAMLGILSGILAMPVSRARGKRKTIVGHRRPEARKEEKKKEINGVPPRLPDASTGPGGKSEAEELDAASETRGVRGRIDPIRAIHPRSEPRWLMPARSLRIVS